MDRIINDTAEHIKSIEGGLVDSLKQFDELMKSSALSDEQKAIFNKTRIEIEKTVKTENKKFAFDALDNLNKFMKK